MRFKEKRLEGSSRKTPNQKEKVLNSKEDSIPQLLILLVRVTVISFVLNIGSFDVGSPLVVTVFWILTSFSFKKPPRIRIWLFFSAIFSYGGNIALKNSLGH